MKPELHDASRVQKETNAPWSETITCCSVHVWGCCGENSTCGTYSTQGSQEHTHTHTQNGVILLPEWTGQDSPQKSATAQTRTRGCGFHHLLGAKSAVLGKYTMPMYMYIYIYIYLPIPRCSPSTHTCCSFFGVESLSVEEHLESC